MIPIINSNHTAAMVEVFKTNVKNKKTAGFFRGRLLSEFPGHRVYIDTDDADKVLRIESREENIDVCRVIMIFEANDHFCEILNG